MKDLDIKNIQPTRGYVLVEPAKSEAKTSSGIILPENESEKPQHGVVLAVGESDCCSEDNCSDGYCEPKHAHHEHSHEEHTHDEHMHECCGGGCGHCEDGDEEDCCTTPVKVGDKVIYKKWGGNDFKIGETEYQFLKFEDILAVIK